MNGPALLVGLLLFRLGLLALLDRVRRWRGRKSFQEIVEPIRVGSSPDFAGRSSKPVDLTSMLVLPRHSSDPRLTWASAVDKLLPDVL